MGPFAFFPYSCLHFLKDSIISFTIVCSRMLSSRCLLNKNSNFNNLTYCQRRTATPISQRLVPIEDLLSKKNYHAHITATCTHRRLIVQRELPHTYHSDLYPSKTYCPKRTATLISQRLVPIEDLLSKENCHTLITRLVPIEDLLSKENYHTHITATCTHRRFIVQGELPHSYHSDLYPSKTYCPRRTTTPISQRLVAIEDLLSQENCYTHLTTTCIHRRPYRLKRTATPISQQLVAVGDLLNRENSYTHLTATCGYG